MGTHLYRQTTQSRSDSTGAQGASSSQPLLQAKLIVNAPGDAFEQEADRLAQQVTDCSAPQAQGPCSAGGSCPKCDGEGHVHLKRKAMTAVTGGQTQAPPSVYEALRSSASPLESTTRTMMERRFGHDFSKVRVHHGELGTRSAADVGARAYTVGSDLVFGSGEYAPSTTAGRKLIAHELAHVIQQNAMGESAGLLQKDDLDRKAPNAKGWTGAPSNCPSDFCQPLGSNLAANNRRAAKWGPFKGGINIFVSSRVTPLWDEWAKGGSRTIKDLTAAFGSDFTWSPTTRKTSAFLLNAIRAKLTSSPPILASGSSTTVDIPTLIPSEVAAIDVPGDTNEMDFDLPGDIPGNLAGGIGKDQASTPIGKNPSPQDDARIAKGDVTVRDVGASLMVTPRLKFRVVDTIDLCPGNCGAPREQIATVEMSRWEATGISGDVPYTVDFPAPPTLTLPYLIAKPVAPPKVP